MTTNYSSLMYGIIVLVVLSCTKQTQSDTEESTDRILITEQQFASNAMQLGDPSMVGFDSIISCNGRIVPLPDGMAALSVPVSGVVKSINYPSGSYVQQGQVIFEIGGNDVLDLQRDFLQASASFDRMKSEYERLGHLFENAAVPEKEYQLVKSEYLLARSAYQVLRMKIVGAGLDPERISSGKLSDVYPVRAPISGIIGQIRVVVGAFVDSNSSLGEVVHPERLQLELSVFDTDVTHIRKGQLVRFKTATGEHGQTAIISSIGNELTDPARVLVCYARISAAVSRKFIINQIVMSEVVVSTDTVQALPTASFLKSESSTVVLQLKEKKDNNYEFEKIEVKAGRQQNGMTELKEPINQGQYAINGVYNLVL